MQLKPIQMAIIVDLLLSGDDKADNIGRRTGYHRNTVSGEMRSLVELGLIASKGSGNYRLTDKGRERARAHIRAELDIYSGD